MLCFQMMNVKWAMLPILLLYLVVQGAGEAAANSKDVKLFILLYVWTDGCIFFYDQWDSSRAKQNSVIPCFMSFWLTSYPTLYHFPEYFYVFLNTIIWLNITQQWSLCQITKTTTWCQLVSYWNIYTKLYMHVPCCDNNSMESDLLGFKSCLPLVSLFFG